MDPIQALGPERELRHRGGRREPNQHPALGMKVVTHSSVVTGSLAPLVSYLAYGLSNPDKPTRALSADGYVRYIRPLL